MALVGRLFVAVALSDETRHALAAHLSNGAVSMPGRPVVPRNWHLTLRFLGKTDQRDYEVLLHKLDDADLGGSFRLGLGGLGAFPRPRRATVLWVAVTGGEERVRGLAGSVEEAASDAGWLPEERPFHPHVTLSRIRPHQDATAVIDATPPIGVSQDVDRITIFRSHLKGGPPTYEVLETVPL